MKKPLNFILITLVASLLMVSCAKTDNITNAIPKDVYMVVKIDSKTLISKSEYNIFENSAVKGYLDVLKGVVNEEQKMLLEDFIANPNSSGIDLTKDLYIAYPTDGNIMMFLGVNDCKKLYEALVGIDPALKEMIQVEGTQYSMSVQSRGSFAWDDKKFVVYINSGLGSSSERASQNASDYLAIDKDNSFASTIHCEKLMSQKGDIVTYSSIAQAGGMYKQMLSSAMYYKDGVADIASSLAEALQNLKYCSVGGMTFENGKITSDTHIYFENTEAEATFKALKTKTPIKGDLNKYLKPDGMLYFALNLNGNDCLADLEALGLKSVIDSLNQKSEYDINKIISTINGDIVFAINKVDFNSKKASDNDISFFAKVNEEKAKELLSQLVADVKKPLITSKEYNYEVEGVLFGLEGDVLYVITDRATYDNLLQGGNNQPSFDKMIGQYGYLYGDLRVLKLMMPDMSQENAIVQTIVNNGLGLFTTFETNSPDNLNSYFEINMADNNTNSLKQICLYVDNLVMSILGMAMM